MDPPFKAADDDLKNSEVQWFEKAGGIFDQWHARELLCTYNYVVSGDKSYCTAGKIRKLIHQ